MFYSVTKPTDKLILTVDHFIIPSSKFETAKFRIRQFDSYAANTNSTLGDFSLLHFEFKIVRRVSYYLIRVYAPSFLITIASFVGFWIPILGWPARVSANRTFIRLKERSLIFNPT